MERWGIPSKVYTVEPEGEIMPDREELRIGILCSLDLKLAGIAKSASARVLWVEDLRDEAAESAA